MSSLPLDQLRLPSFDKEVDADVDADADPRAEANINATTNSSSGSGEEGNDDMATDANEKIIANDSSQHLLSFDDADADADADDNTSVQATSADADAAPPPVENVDIIGILNSPGTGMSAANANANVNVNAAGSITPLLPLTPRGGGRKTNNADVNMLLTPDRGRDRSNENDNGNVSSSNGRSQAEMLQQNHQRHISYSSIANDDFPTIEFVKTAESSDGSAPLSPLTP